MITAGDKKGRKKIGLGLPAVSQSPAIFSTVHGRDPAPLDPRLDGCKQSASHLTADRGWRASTRSSLGLDAAGQLGDAGLDAGDARLDRYATRQRL
jgi:hypothetical protein